MLRQQLDSAARTDVLRPLAWLVGILVIGIIGLVHADAPSWTLLLLGATVGFVILLYAAAYTYCLAFDRDALRSEKYAIQKLAIEKGVYGDDNIGIIDAERDVTLASLEAPTENQQGDR